MFVHEGGQTFLHMKGTNFFFMILHIRGRDKQCYMFGGSKIFTCEGGTNIFTGEGRAKFFTTIFFLGGGGGTNIFANWGDKHFRLFFPKMLDLKLICSQKSF